MGGGFWVVYISIGISEKSTSIYCNWDVEWVGEGCCHGVGMRK